MMQFRLEFIPKPFEQKINHRDDLLLVGSCFTENIGAKLQAAKFNVLQNPNGILFNPVSVQTAVENYIFNRQVTVQDLFYFNEGYHSWEHHSRFSALDAATAVQQINRSTTEAHHFLQKANWLIVTLGSAWVYTLTEKALGGRLGAVAANNHKAPADWFYRRLMGLEELQTSIDNMLYKLRNYNPHINVVFTISPVRHLREGFVESNRSKALLNVAVQNIVEKFAFAHYFPAYELVIDDLRDYRFFAEDMVHPNYAATNYVWDKFKPCCIDEVSLKLMEEINEINMAFSHKPFNPHSKAHADFKQKYRSKIEALLQRHPYLDFAKELAHFA